MFTIKEKGFDKGEIVHLGNKFLLGNGFMGYRGTLEEYSCDECVALNMAGVYDRVGDLWREPINAPNPLFTQITIDNNTLSPINISPSYHVVSLNIKKALFQRKTTFKLKDNCIRIFSERFLNMNNYHNITSSYSFTVEKDCVITLDVGIDSKVWNLNGKHLIKENVGEENNILYSYSTTSEKGRPFAVALGICEDFQSDYDLIIKNEKIIRRYKIKCYAGQTRTIHKHASVFYDNDALVNALANVRLQISNGYNNELANHTNCWKKLWKIADVKLKGDNDAELALRYSIYHILSLTPREKGSIAARGLSGQTYKGAVFWDTEIFLLPFFLALTPDCAKKLIQYRIEGLKGAKEKAKGYGYEGAFYAWESQENGYDACSDFNVVDVFTKRPVRTYFKDKQIHISGDIAYALIKYYFNTKDVDLMLNCGLEMLLECSLFFYSYSYFNHNKDRFELLDVIGPDEYHERINNNAFTNYLAYFTVSNALKLIVELKKKWPSETNEILCKLNYKEHIPRLKDFVKKLYLPKPNEDCIIEQFDGYFKLEDVTVSEVKARLADKNEYWGGSGGVATATKVIKQADVITLLALFPELFDEKTIQKSWEYYNKYTEHGSSLSASMYALSACLIGKADAAYEFFLKTANVDLTGKSKQFAGKVYIGGTHPAANGGAWLTAVMGFGGLSFKGGKAVISPNLPEKILELSFCINEKGKYYRYTIFKDKIIKKRIKQ